MNPTDDPTMGPAKTPRPRPTKPAGWIYLIHTWDDDTKYVGQTEQPVWQRVNGHRKDKPWGRDIKPGREGYTILRRVESSGKPAIDAILLDLAEAEAIEQWVPSDNANRPAPAMFRERLTTAGYDPTGNPTGRPAEAWPSWLGQPMDLDGNFVGSPTKPSRGVRSNPTRHPTRHPTRRTPRGARGVTVGQWKAVGFAILSALWVVLAVRISAGTSNPTTPWIVVPVAALLGPVGTVALVRRTLRGGRRRRRYRRR